MVGWGIRGSNDTDTGAPSSVGLPIDLSINELIAMTTWFYVTDGEKPPSPVEIENAYKKFVDPARWNILLQTRNLPKLDAFQTRGQVWATGDEAVSDIFHLAACDACHTIPGILRATGTMGPPLGLKTTAASRLKDPSYRGKAHTAAKRQHRGNMCMNRSLIRVPTLSCHFLIISCPKSTAPSSLY
jgi:hypothetical protein